MTPRTIAIHCAVSCILLSLTMAGCGDQSPPTTAPTIRLATTTSTQNSGLLDVLLPAFTQKTGINVQVLPMGTGKALAIAREGNCDVLMVHAPEAEAQFVSQGWGVNHQKIMYNDFVILGPPSDPAQLRQAKTAAEAMTKIAATKNIFISRGDNSGTHIKELALWAEAKVEPTGSWYRPVGMPMGNTLSMANQVQGYVLADRGTYLKFSKKIDMVVLFESGPALHNPYGIMAVNPAKHPHVKYHEALALIAFLTSEQGRKIISEYRVSDQILFHPWPEFAESQ